MARKEDTAYKARRSSSGKKIADITALSVLIRLSIDLASSYDLLETEDELRRALLGIHLEFPELAAIADISAWFDDAEATE